MICLYSPQSVIEMFRSSSKVHVTSIKIWPSATSVTGEFYRRRRTHWLSPCGKWDRSLSVWMRNRNRSSCTSKNGLVVVLKFQVFNDRIFFNTGVAFMMMHFVTIPRWITQCYWWATHQHIGSSKTGGEAGVKVDTWKLCVERICVEFVTTLLLLRSNKIFDKGITKS